MFQELFLNNWNSLKEGVTPLAYGRISFCFKFQYVSLVSVEKKKLFNFWLFSFNTRKSSLQIRPCWKFHPDIFLWTISPRNFSYAYFHLKKKTCLSFNFWSFSNHAGKLLQQEIFHWNPILRMESFFHGKSSDEEFLPRKISTWRISPAKNSATKNCSHWKLSHGKFPPWELPPSHKKISQAILTSLKIYPG